MSNLNGILMNPVRSRIIQYLAVNKTCTAGELVSFMTDVPRTTLYRHLNILADNEVIKVVAENRIRGSVERTYSLNLESIAKENTSEKATGNAFGFLLGIYADFERYFKEEYPNPEVDKIFLSNVTLLLSDEEFDELIQEINVLFTKYLNNSPRDERKPRSISFISSPAIRVESEGEGINEEEK